MSKNLAAWFYCVLALALFTFPTFAQADTETCEAFVSGVGSYTCEFYAEAGDVIETSCEGCSGTGIFGSIGWQLYSPSRTTLLDSNSDSTRLTLSSTGTYEFATDYDFGFHIGSIPGRCGLRDAAGYEYCEPDTTIETPREGTVTITIRWISRANQPTSEPATSDNTSQSENTTSAPNTTTSGEESASAGFDFTQLLKNPLFTPIVFITLIIAGVLSLIIGLMIRKFSRGAVVALLLVGGGIVQITAIDSMGLDKLLDLAVTSGVMDMQSTINLRPRHNLFEVANITDVLGRNRDGMYLVNSETTWLNGDIFSGDLAPDGSQIVYAVCATIYDCSIHIADRDGSNKEQLVEKGFNPLWSPDGTRIAYVGDSRNLIVMNPDGTNRRELYPVAEPDTVQWSPDSSQLAFSADEKRLVIINADGTGLQEILDKPGWIEWSPDGEHIVIMTRGYNAEAFIADSDGTNARKVSEARWLTWGADGETILRTEYDQSSILDANTLDIITTIQNVEFVYVELLNEKRSRIVLTPDGEYIIYDPDDEVFPNLPDTVFMVITADTGELRMARIDEKLSRLFKVR